MSEKFPNRAALLAFMVERENVRIRRERGDPPPWTDDPILREWRFCNIRREDDRVTKWIAENWRTPHADDPDLWFAMTVARQVNWPPTLEELGWPLPWNREHFVATMKARAERGEKQFGNAYRVYTKAGASTAVHVADMLDELWAARERVRPKPGERLEVFHGRLKDYGKGLGNFHAAQVIADSKYATAALKDAPDWMTFAASGPGSQPGLNYVMGRARDAPWKEESWRLRGDGGRP